MGRFWSRAVDLVRFDFGDPQRVEKSWRQRDLLGRSCGNTGKRWGWPGLRWEQQGWREKAQPPEALRTQSWHGGGVSVNIHSSDLGDWVDTDVIHSQIEEKEHTWGHQKISVRELFPSRGLWRGQYVWLIGARSTVLVIARLNTKPQSKMCRQLS